MSAKYAKEVMKNGRVRRTQISSDLGQRAYELLLTASGTISLYFS